MMNLVINFRSLFWFRRLLLNISGSLINLLTCCGKIEALGWNNFFWQRKDFFLLGLWSTIFIWKRRRKQRVFWIFFKLLGVGVSSNSEWLLVWSWFWQIFMRCILINFNILGCKIPMCLVLVTVALLIFRIFFNEIVRAILTLFSHGSPELIVATATTLWKRCWYTYPGAVPSLSRLILSC